MTNLVTLVVALFLVFGLSSASYSYTAMAISLVLQVRGGLSDSGAGGREEAGSGLWPVGRLRGLWGLDYTLAFGHL